MQIEIDKANGTPIYAQLASRIRHLIIAGRLEADEQLPPVRKLAEQLLINPNTVARAYRALEADSLVNSREGSGVYVADSAIISSRRERGKLLHESIDALLSEAHTLDVDLESLVLLIRQRGRNAAKQKQENE